MYEKVFVTAAEVRTDITSAIEASGVVTDAAAEYDLDAISAACYTYRSPENAAQRAGWICTVTNEKYWQTIKANAR